MNIAICDDEARFRMMFRDCLEEKINGIFDNVVIDEYESGEAFLRGCRTCDYDCVFMDMYMGGMNGFETTKELHKMSGKTKVIYLTSNSTLVYDCFDYQPFYFLKKDNYMDILPRVIKKMADDMNRDTIISLDINGVVESVRTSNICYITSEQHNIYIQTTKYHYELRKNISEMERILKPYGFVRIHRRSLVNLHYIKKINMRTDTVVMSDDVMLDMSRRSKDMVMDRYREYQRSVEHV